MKTMLVKFLSVCVTGLLLLFCFQGRTVSVPVQCPDGYYYAECIPLAGNPCYSGCVPMPGTQIIFEGNNEEYYTVQIGCNILEDDNFCSVKCSGDHLFAAKEKGTPKHVYTPCPVCGSNVFTLLK